MNLTFTGILRSEFIKLHSLRSTVWCFAVLAFLTISIGLLLVLLTPDSSGLDYDSQQTIAVTAATAGVGFSQLVICVLGALVITGEYGTGMIRSTFTAVPKRLPALFGKALVFGAATFVVSAVSIVLTALLTAPLLATVNVSTDFGNPEIWQALFGAAGYLTLVGLLALGLGAIIRNSAGGIAAVLGLILVLPAIVGLFTALTTNEAAGTIAAFLPNNAGSRMYAYVVEIPAGMEQFALPGITLEPWQGGLVVLAWVVAFFALASVLLKRRDA